MLPIFHLLLEAFYSTNLSDTMRIIFVYQSTGENEMDNLEVDDDMSYNNLNTANVAERYDNIEVLLDIESESESKESDDNSHVSDISENIVVNEQTEIEIIDDISTNSLLTNKHDCCNGITVSSSSIWCKFASI